MALGGAFHGSVLEAVMKPSMVVLISGAWGGQKVGAGV